MPKPLKLLIAESEPADQREARRAETGRSSAETMREALGALAPDARIDLVRPDEDEAPEAGLAAYDGFVLAGSPLHVYQDGALVRRNVDFVRAAFAAGLPGFGSCAGLQLAVAAAGGRVRLNPAGHEIGFARRIARRAEGIGHPLLDGRPNAYDAAAIHSDEVETLPADGSRHLAGNEAAAVQAAEIRSGSAVFWGVQYHPELPLDEVAAGVRRQSDTLLERGLARSADEVEAQADLIAELGRGPERLDLAWRLGVGPEVADPERRRLELRNFLRHLVEPTASRRGRA